MARTTAQIANPLLTLPAAQRVCDLPEDSRQALRDVLLDLRRQAAEKAQREWKRNKGMTAAYWKAVSIYAGHAAKLCRASRPTTQEKA